MTSTSEGMNIHEVLDEVRKERGENAVPIAIVRATMVAALTALVKKPEMLHTATDVIMKACDVQDLMHFNLEYAEIAKTFDNLPVDFLWSMVHNAQRNREQINKGLKEIHNILEVTGFMEKAS